jgi:hypothetical protein
MVSIFHFMIFFVSNKKKSLSIGILLSLFHRVQNGKISTVSSDAFFVTVFECRDGI